MAVAGGQENHPETAGDLKIDHLRHRVEIDFIVGGEGGRDRAHRSGEREAYFLA
ncbi:hypothetical protein SDC9_98900 [bioreactor metagenome]|uniref:Uncharacterized protein n=1 Tax=bioreactor metagenome TaxID=1076179 RepID=A0A645ARB7_9ZZZZ